MSKKMTFAEKLKMQKEEEEHGSEEVPEQVEVQEKPKKTRKPRGKKKTEKVEEVSEVSEEVVPEAVAEKPKKERKSRKKEVLEGGSVVSDEKPKKEKRPPSTYNLFVKDFYKREEVQKLPPKERFAKVAELWHQQKARKAK